MRARSRRRLRSRRTDVVRSSRRAIWPGALSRCLAALVLTCASAAALAASTTSEVVLEFQVNQAGSETLIVQRTSDGVLLLDEASFAQLRLLLPSVPARIIDGRRYFPLIEIPGITIALDEPRQRVAIF